MHEQNQERKVFHLAAAQVEQTKQKITGLPVHLFSIICLHRQLNLEPTSISSLGQNLTGEDSSPVVSLPLDSG